MQVTVVVHVAEAKWWLELWLPAICRGGPAQWGLSWQWVWDPNNEGHLETACWVVGSESLILTPASSGQALFLWIFPEDKVSRSRASFLQVRHSLALLL